MILTSPTQRFVPLSMLVVCSLVLALMLVACGGGSATSSDPAAQPTTADQSTATPQPTSGSSTTTYTGNGFTIDYPQDWKTSMLSTSEVEFTNPSNIVALDINVVDDTSGKSATDLLSAALQNFQSNPTKYPNFQTVDMPATTTVGGETWSQGAFTYDYTTNGQTTPTEIVLLVDVHSTGSSTPKAFSVAYGAPAALFDQVNNDSFQPMLQSFAFA
jgi:hypothetical protein